MNTPNWITRILFVAIKRKHGAGYKFNLLNPISYILLIIAALIVGVVQGSWVGIKSFLDVILTVTGDAVSDTRTPPPAPPLS